MYRRGRRLSSPHLHLKVLLPKVKPRLQGENASHPFDEGSSPEGVDQSKSQKQNLFPPKIAVVVSQKVSKRAVTRNRIRRQIQGILHPWLKQFPRGIRVIVTPNSAAIGCNSGQFLQELEQLFVEAKVLDGYS